MPNFFKERTFLEVTPPLWVGRVGGLSDFDVTPNFGVAGASLANYSQVFLIDLLPRNGRSIPHCLECLRKLKIKTSWPLAIEFKGHGTFVSLTGLLPKHLSLEIDTFTKLTNMKTAAIVHKDLNHDEIAARAYQIWEVSGRPPGSELQNWLIAEKELAASAASNGRTDAERTMLKTARPSPIQPTSKPQTSQHTQRQPRMTAQA